MRSIVKVFCGLLFVLVISAIPAHAQSHAVALAWTASIDAVANSTLTYNLYRAASSCATASSFTKVNTAAISGTSFTDSSVTVGNTYCYQATSVLNGLESVDSNQTAAVILPAPPTALTATPH